MWPTRDGHGPGRRGPSGRSRPRRQGPAILLRLHRSLRLRLPLPGVPKKNRAWPPFRDQARIWTRTQRIRTAGALPFEVVLVDAEEEPSVYQRVATKALHLRDLGLSDRVIAQRLGVSDKTVGKAIRWLGRLSP